MNNHLLHLGPLTQINLRKITEAEAMIIRKERLVRTKPVLLDENGRELDHIPEPETEQEPAVEELEIPEIPTPEINMNNFYL